ncbi:hypothetical protein Pan216_07250 [Planctomycetes bacterium Pan216]|uniref:VWFA domain-containing protein n=1 Tax=Kolteria novifilia TaxID=2527975 RepID=A0A518AYV2_9BACT|nr:hypothetical protein Pan216_07250 [Planctomycetes bacterium Pan216]
MGSQEKYLKPEVIRQVKRLDLRARFIVEGFISGLHASPFQGFSTEFSEHRKYTPGDDPSTIDWNVFAKTDRFYVKKYEAETNLDGYLVMDLSASMDYTHDQELTKFEYGICLAASLAYLMIHQSDAVGLVTFDTKVRNSLPPRSRRTQLSAILALLAKLKPTGTTDIAASLHQVAAMVRHRSLLMVFSDLLNNPDDVIRGLHHLKHGGNDVIVFHILDAAEAEFPFHGMVELEDVESDRKMVIDSDGLRADYLEALAEFQDRYRRDFAHARIDYVPVHTGMPFDRALMEYLVDRSRRA